MFGSNDLGPGGLLDRQADGRPRGQDVEPGPQFRHSAHRSGVDGHDQLAHLQNARGGPAGLHLGHLGAAIVGGVGALHPQPAVHDPILGPEVIGDAHHEVAGQEGGG
jgi:hypothetical protein